MIDSVKERYCEAKDGAADHEFCLKYQIEKLLEDESLTEECQDYDFDS